MKCALETIRFVLYVLIGTSLSGKLEPKEFFVFVLILLGAKICDDCLFFINEK